MKTIALTTLALCGGWDMLGPAAAGENEGFNMSGERPRPAAGGSAAREGAAPAAGRPGADGPGGAVRPLPPKVLVYTAAWCGPCRAFEADVLPKLVAAGWKVGDGPADQVRLVDCTDCLPDGIDSLPAFVLLEGEREVRRHVGPLDTWGVGEFAKGYSERPAAKATVTPAPSAGPDIRPASVFRRR